MRVFITGATGNLGSAVASALLADGHEVHAHMRSADAARRLPADARPVTGDLADATWLRAQIDQADGVVHTASPNDATSSAFEAAFLDVTVPVLVGPGPALVHTRRHLDPRIR